METANKGSEIMKLLLKELRFPHTVSSLAEKLKMSRVGVWKILKKLEKDKSVILTPIGKGKTSTYSISLNWNNLLVEKKLALILTEDAVKQERWRFNFRELEKNASFLLLFGSILYNPDEARDIDLFIVINDKNKFKEIDKTMSRIQTSQIKKIHYIDLTRSEFELELKNKNQAYLDAVCKGVVLYGQENFINLIKFLKTK